MSIRVVYLDKSRHVRILHSFLSTQTHCKAHCVISTQTKLAAKFGVSLASIKRDLAELEKKGFLKKGYIPRPRGGRLCIYWVVTGIYFRVKSFIRKANELLVSYGKEAPGAGYTSVEEGGSKDVSNTNKRHTSVPPSSLNDVPLQDLLQVVDNLQFQGEVTTLDDTQRAYLIQATKKFGVRRTWYALLKAVQTGRYSATEVVRVTWAILRRQGNLEELV